jgi:hypothetical protein
MMKCGVTFQNAIDDRLDHISPWMLDVGCLLKTTNAPMTAPERHEMLVTCRPSPPIHTLHPCATFCDLARLLEGVTSLSWQS